jgi:hypothetical protein
LSHDETVPRAGGWSPWRCLVIASVNAPCFTSMADLHARFLAIEPRIRTHARVYFRGVKCPAKKEDFIAETIALAWKWFRGLLQRGKDATQFVSTLASFAAKAVKWGRRVTGQVKAKDVLNERNQQRRGFTVSKLPDFSTLSTNPLVEALADNTRTPPPDAAAFRIDWPAWLRTRTRRDRRIIRDMMANERTMDLAQKFKISPARVSQLRREFCEDWNRFCSDRPERQC